MMGNVFEEYEKEAKKNGGDNIHISMAVRMSYEIERLRTSIKNIKTFVEGM